MGGVAIAAKGGTTGLASLVLRPENDPFFPTFVAGAKVQNMPRELADNSIGVLASGRMSLAGVRVYPGLVISKITFVSGTVAGASLTNQWFSLSTIDGNRTLLAVTADDLTNAWVANTPKTLTLATPYTIPQNIYGIYAGCLVAGTTPPQLQGAPGSNGVVSSGTAFTPMLSANSGSGITVPLLPGATLSAFAQSAPPAYVIFS